MSHADRGPTRRCGVADHSGCEESWRPCTGTSQLRHRRCPHPVHADRDRFVRLHGDIDGDAGYAVVGDRGAGWQKEGGRAEPARRAGQVEPPVGPGGKLEDHTLSGVEQLHQVDGLRGCVSASKPDDVVDEHLPVSGSVADVEQGIGRPLTCSGRHPGPNEPARADVDDAVRAGVVSNDALDGKSGGEPDHWCEDRLGAHRRNSGRSRDGATGRAKEAHPEPCGRDRERYERE